MVSATARASYQRSSGCVRKRQTRRISAMAISAAESRSAYSSAGIETPASVKGSVLKDGMKGATAGRAANRPTSAPPPAAPAPRGLAKNPSARVASRSAATWSGGRLDPAKAPELGVIAWFMPTSRHCAQARHSSFAPHVYLRHMYICATCIRERVSPEPLGVFTARGYGGEASITWACNARAVVRIASLFTGAARNCAYRSAQMASRDTGSPCALSAKVNASLSQLAPLLRATGCPDRIFHHPRRDSQELAQQGFARVGVHMSSTPMNVRLKRALGPRHAAP
jgi:hypothetical protein